VCGDDPVTAERAVKDRIGFVHEVPAYYDHLRVGAIASIVRPFYSRWDQPLFEALVREFEVPTGKWFGSLSRGTRTKAALALALAHHADLLVLDEPTGRSRPGLPAVTPRTAGRLRRGRPGVGPVLDAHHQRPRADGRLSHVHPRRPSGVLGDA